LLSGSVLRGPKTGMTKPCPNFWLLQPRSQDLFCEKALATQQLPSAQD